MTDDFIQIDKQTLDEYYHRVLRTNSNFKYLQLQFLWGFIHDSATFKPICDVLKSKNPHLSGLALDIVDYQKVIPLPEKHKDRVCLTYFIIDQILKPNHNINLMSILGRNYSPESDKQGNPEKFFELFNDLFLEPFIYFISHEASRHFFILGLLKKYKYRTEWFNRQKLYSLAKTKTTNAEASLKANLYKYLFDNGLVFSIEPSSPSGEIDFIGSQKNSPNKILAEGKIFDGNSRGKQYIIKGAWQLLTYIKENNEKEGFLVVYSLSEKIISPKFSQNNDGLPYVVIDNKRIYFIIIDIFSYDKTASKRGQQQIIEVTDDDMQKLTNISQENIWADTAK